MPVAGLVDLLARRLHVPPRGQEDDDLALDLLRLRVEVGEEAEDDHEGVLAERRQVERRRLRQHVVRREVLVVQQGQDLLEVLWVARRKLRRLRQLHEAAGDAHRRAERLALLVQRARDAAPVGVVHAHHHAQLRPPRQHLPQVCEDDLGLRVQLLEGVEDDAANVRQVFVPLQHAQHRLRRRAQQLRRRRRQHLERRVVPDQVPAHLHAVVRRHLRGHRHTPEGVRGHVQHAASCEALVCQRHLRHHRRLAAPHLARHNRDPARLQRRLDLLPLLVRGQPAQSGRRGLPRSGEGGAAGGAEGVGGVGQERVLGGQGGVGGGGHLCVRRQRRLDHLARLVVDGYAQVERHGAARRQEAVGVLLRRVGVLLARSLHIGGRHTLEAVDTERLRHGGEPPPPCACHRVVACPMKYRYCSFY
eukprot:Rhum_TRINITY_DN10143_c0_g1::Rhum_TRINITY_DN10143_c0_g1_i1::g.37083::m.37083